MRVLVLSALVVVALAYGLWAVAAVRRIEARHPPTGERVDIGAGRIHVTRREPAGPARATVLLLHGASGNQADLMEALGDRLAARGFRVFAADRPGHGWSDRTPGADHAPAQAAAIRAALERLGVRRAIVLGHSWAGALAESFLLDHADFVEGGVLVAPVTHPWPGGISWYYRVASLPLVGPVFAWLVALPAGLATIEGGVGSVFRPGRAPQDFIERTGAALVLRPSVFVNNAVDVARLKAFVTTQAPREPQIAQPVAIVAGDSDGVVSTTIHSRASVTAIPDATLTVLPGVGHSPHWVAPEAVVAAVESVADRLQRARERRPETVSSAPGTSSK